MKKEKIINLIKLGMLAIMLILLFFISDRFVDYLVTVDVEVLKKAVYVILATTVVGIYTMEQKPTEKREKMQLPLFDNREKKEKESKEKRKIFDFNK